MPRLYESAAGKWLRSHDYNYDFDKRTGFFRRWGRTEDDDPDWSSVGPEIADIEISTICHQGCRFCYKSNGAAGHNMTIATFRQVLAKLPRVCTQIAFGIGSIDANPDLWDILHSTRLAGIIPNITINGYRMQPQHYRWLADVCGAVAVSRYEPDVCYEAVQRLSAQGLDQVNIHQLLCEETFDECMQVIHDAKTDPRLRGLRAIVFLALKPVGRGTSLTPLRDVERYRRLIETALDANVGIGFDSCSAPMFLAATQQHPRYELFKTLAEPCESTLFSVYIDAFARMHPCSFLENSGVSANVLTAEDFVRDVWLAPAVVKWREQLLRTARGGLVEGCRQCPAFEIYP